MGHSIKKYSIILPLYKSASKQFNLSRLKRMKQLMIWGWDLFMIKDQGQLGSEMYHALIRIEEKINK